MSELQDPRTVVDELRMALLHLGRAHTAAAEKEELNGTMVCDLNGWHRDMLFGLNTAIDSYASMLEEQYSLEFVGQAVWEKEKENP